MLVGKTAQARLWPWSHRGATPHGVLGSWTAQLRKHDEIMTVGDLRQCGDTAIVAMDSLWDAVLTTN